MRRGMLRALGVLLLVSLLLPSVCLADMGPKPSMTVRLLRSGQPFSAVGIQLRLLACQEGASEPWNPDQALPALNRVDLTDPSGCTWQIPSYPVFSSYTEGTASFSYMLPDRFRVAVYDPAADRLWLSNAADRQGMHTSFQLDLRDDGTAVLVSQQQNILQKSWDIGRMLAALLISLVLELALVVGYVLWQRRRWQPYLLAGLIGNIISLPLVWLLAGIAYLLGGSATGLVAMAIGEVLAVFFEALLYCLICKERYGRMLLLSLAANVLSFAVGLLLH
ncbi:MAG: hypothetical protein ACYCZF_06895 [Anaerolineae bacterium]